MELNSLAKMERRGEKRRGCLGRELAAKLCTGGPSSKMLAGKLQFFFFSPYTMTLLCVQKLGGGSWVSRAQWPASFFILFFFILLF